MSLKKYIIEPIKKNIKIKVQKIVNSHYEKKSKVETKIANTSYNLIWKNDHLIKDKICYFATYDKEGRIDPYVFYYLQEIYKCGFNIVLISTSRFIDDRDLHLLKKNCSVIILRVNKGYDFFSWKIGIKLFPPENITKRVLFANDSVYGPFDSLQKYIKKMDFSTCDAISMTDSWEFSYHMQSYFIYIKENILRSNFLQEFFNSLEVQVRKENIIKKYEVRFSKSLLENNFQIGAIAEYLEVNEKFYKEKIIDYSYSLNQTITYWDVLIKYNYIPFLKKNIFSILGIDQVRIIKMLRDINKMEEIKYNINILVEHLKKTYFK